VLFKLNTVIVVRGVGMNKKDCKKLVQAYENGEWFDEYENNLEDLEEILNDIQELVEDTSGMVFKTGVTSEELLAELLDLLNDLLEKV